MFALARLASRLFPVLLGLIATDVAADVLRAAVASNFRPAMDVLGQEFERRYRYELTISYGSSGKHFAQISNGAPFDVFLAADSERPRILESRGLAVAGSRFTYAIGRLVLWAPDAEVSKDGAAFLGGDHYRFLAIANPRTAPYGLAAQQALEGLGLWGVLQPRVLRGENVAQAFSFVQSGNAEIGLIALSQVKTVGTLKPDSMWLVPEELYSPIEQQAVLIRDGEAARVFLGFLRGDEAVAMIRAHGYRLQ